ncbi:MAG: hypothetical protein ACO3N7_03995, partial [Kiritimatiellia bacterium]
ATVHYTSPSQVVMCQFEADGSPIGRTYFNASPGVPVRMMSHPEQGFIVQGAVQVEAPAGSADNPGAPE